MMRRIGLALAVASAMVLAACVTAPSSDLEMRLNNVELGLTLAAGLNDSAEAGRLISADAAAKVRVTITAARTTIALTRQLIAQGQFAEAARHLAEADAARLAAEAAVDSAAPDTPSPPS